MKSATNEAINAYRTPCRSDELKGETIVEVLSPDRCPAISRLQAYHAYALRMASGKVFAVTTCMGEVHFSRAYPDMPATSNPSPRDPVREARWVVCLGDVDGQRTFIKHPAAGTVTVNLDEAWGWRYKKDADDECVWRRCPSLPNPRAGRRSSFR
jgi:hypothetical protein